MLNNYSNHTQTTFKLSEGEKLQIASYKDCFKIINCKIPNEKCYFGEYNQCPGLKILEQFLMLLLRKKDITDVQFKQWIASPRTTIETFIKSVDEFVLYFCNKVVELLPHAFIALQQSKFSKDLKERLKNGDFQIVVDFAENYAFTVQDAAPGFHWYNDQATIYNMVIYYKEGDTVRDRSLVVISDCLTHDSVAVYTFHCKMIQYLKDECTLVNKIYYFSDGAPQQYKNYKNVLNLLYHKKDFLIDAEWHFYPTAHGKGPCDGLGATVKRGAIRASLQTSSNREILTCQDLYNWLITTERMSRIDFRYSDQADYNKSKRFLTERFQINTRIKYLQDQHCLMVTQEGIIRAKRFSESDRFNDTKFF